MLITLLAVLAQLGPETVTTKPLNFYIDPNGSNEADCQQPSPGRVCATLNGVFARIPKNVRHAINVSAAPGTYAAEASILEDFVVTSDGYVLVRGSMRQATLATGAVTGTLTGVSNTAPSPTFTDSGQAWTVNALRGLHVRMTSGAANGNLSVIISNTATVLTLVSPMTGTVAISDTYEIVQPAAIFTGAQAASATETSVLAVRNVRGRAVATSNGITVGRVGFAQVAFNQTGTSVQAIRLGDAIGPRFECIECSVLGSISNVAGASVLNVSLARTAVSSVAAGGAGAFSWAGGALRSLQGPTYWKASSGVTWRVSNNAVVVISQSTNQVLETQLTTTTALRVTGGSILTSASGASTGFVLICPSGSTTGVGVWLETYSIATNGISNEFSSPQVTITNCATGVLVEGPSYFATTGALSHTTGTTGVSVTRGGRARLTGLPVFTTVTNELSLDGTVQTLATLNAASPQVLSNTTYASHISR